jgi:hypothetical protein
LEKYTKTGINVPNNHKIYQMTTKYVYQMAVKQTKMPYNIQTSSIARPSKILTKKGFWV